VVVVVEVVVEVVEVVASFGSGQMISFLNFSSITSGFWPLLKLMMTLSLRVEPFLITLLFLIGFMVNTLLSLDFTE